MNVLITIFGGGRDNGFSLIMRGIGIFSPKADKSAPTDVWGIVFISKIG